MFCGQFHGTAAGAFPINNVRHPGIPLYGNSVLRQNLYGGIADNPGIQLADPQQTVQQSGSLAYHFICGTEAGNIRIQKSH